MNKGRNISIMGIVNLTDDSFFAGSRCADVSAALARIGSMVEEGMDIVDIGACSTRPGALPVGEDEEWRRLEPVLRALRKDFPDLPVSVDTYFSSVVEKVHDLIGPFVVNDISAGEADPDMLPVVGHLKLRYVAMHMRGDSMTMQSLTVYNDVTSEVVGYFRKFAVKAEQNGVEDWILDPGFGFAKTLEQNYKLLFGLREFGSVLRADGIVPPILVGLSRKSMIYKFFNITPEESLAPLQVLHLIALQNGTDMLRVHDVKEAVRTVQLYNLSIQ